jgi:hypothetical protein
MSLNRREALGAMLSVPLVGVVPQGRRLVVRRVNFDYHQHKIDEHGFNMIYWWANIECWEDGEEKWWTCGAGDGPACEIGGKFVCHTAIDGYSHFVQLERPVVVPESKFTAGIVTEEFLRGKEA